MAYAPSPVPSDPQQLPAYLRSEFERIKAELQPPKVTYVAPAKPRVAQQYYADGTQWNPGSGEGLYVFKSTGWKFLG